MAQLFCDAGLGFPGLVELSVPQQEWKHGLRRTVQPSRMLAASLVCGIGQGLEVMGCGAPVQDATAAPPVRRDCYKLAPRTLALKTRRARKRGSGGRNDEEGDDGGSDDGGFGGDGSWGGGENGRGGWDSWGESWNDESRRWDEGRDALALLYQAACWISLSKCVHYVIVKAVGWGRESGPASAEEVPPFAQCSSVFLRREAVLVPAVVGKILC